MRKLITLGMALLLCFVLSPTPAQGYTPRCSTISTTWHIGYRPVPYTLANVYVTGRACMAADGYIDNSHSYLSFTIAKVNISTFRFTHRGTVEYVDTRAQEVWRFYGADQQCAYWICSPTALWYFNSSLLLLYRGSVPIVTRTAYIFCQNTWCGGAGTYTKGPYWR